MKEQREIQDILERLKARKGYRDIDTEKLLNLFRYSELTVPEELVSTEMSPSRSFVVRQVEKPRPLAGILPVLRWAVVPALLVLGAVIFFTARPFFLPGGGSGTGYAVAGAVERTRGSTTSSFTAGDHVREGDILRTAPGARADLEFRSFVRVRVSGNSTVKIMKARFLPDERMFEILVSRGTAIIHSRKTGENDEIAVLTPCSRATVRGTIFGVTINGGREARYEVFEGSIKVKNRVATGDFLDKRDTLIIEEYFEEHSVLVKENQVCRVSPADEVVRAGDSVMDTLQQIDRPEIVTDRDEGFVTADELRGFIVTPGSTDREPEMVSVRIITEPDNAAVYINGRKREHSGGDILITRGDHELTAEAPGYNTLEKKITVGEGTGALRVTLEKMSLSSIDTWISGLDAAYLAYDAGLNYLVSVNRNGHVEATDMDKLIWSARLEQEISSTPIVFRGTLYLITSDNRLTAMSVDRGTILWRMFITGSVGEKLSIIHDNSSLYIGTDQGRLYRIGFNGRQIWKAIFSEPIVAAPVFNSYMVYAALKDGTVIGVDRRTGVKVFKRRFSGSPSASLAADDDNLYLGRGNLVSGFNIRKDEITWQYKTSMVIISHIACDRGSVFAYSGSGFVYNFTSGGEFLWRTQLGNNIVGAPVMDDENLYIVCDRILFVINREQGHVAWSLVVPPVLTGNLAVSKDRMYFVSRDRGLISLKK